jgi:hypothetical protein
VRGRWSVATSRRKKSQPTNALPTIAPPNVNSEVAIVANAKPILNANEAMPACSCFIQVASTTRSMSAMTTSPKKPPKSSSTLSSLTGHTPEHHVDRAKSGMASLCPQWGRYRLVGFPAELRSAIRSRTGWKAAVLQRSRSSVGSTAESGAAINFKRSSVAR